VVILTSLRSAASAFTKIIGAREAMLFVGVGLVAGGLEQVSPPAALWVPGAILVYVAVAGLR
jgi:hypothetical protein